MSADCQPNPPLERAGLYVDGFNLYHSVDDLGEPFLKWCNLWRLGEIIIPSKTEKLSKVVFCTAYYPGDHGKRIRHENLINAYKMKGVETILGHYSKEGMDCRKCGNKWDKPTEKASDINLALSVYDDAARDLIDCAYLLTADTDQAATAKMFRERFPHKRLVSVSPPGRVHSQHILSHASSKIALNRDHIERSLLPAVVMADGHRTVIRPPEYAPPQGYVHWDDRPQKAKGPASAVQ